MRTKVEIGLKARDDGSYVGLIPKNKRLTESLQEYSFEILTNEPNYNTIYLKEYDDEEQLRRAADHDGFHRGYSIEAFYEFLKSRNEDSSYPFIFEQNPSQTPNSEFLTMEQNQAYLSFLRTCEPKAQKSNSPSQQTTLSRNAKTAIGFFGGVSLTAGAWTLTQLIAPEFMTSLMKCCFLSLITANPWIAMLMVATTIGVITALLVKGLSSTPQLAAQSA